MPSCALHVTIQLLCSSLVSNSSLAARVLGLQIQPHGFQELNSGQRLVPLTFLTAEPFYLFWLT